MIARLQRFFTWKLMAGSFLLGLLSALAGPSSLAGVHPLAWPLVFVFAGLAWLIPLKLLYLGIRRFVLAPIHDAWNRYETPDSTAE